MNALSYIELQKKISLQKHLFKSTCAKMFISINQPAFFLPFKSPSIEILRPTVCFHMTRDKVVSLFHLFIFCILIFALRHITDETNLLY